MELQCSTSGRLDERRGYHHGAFGNFRRTRHAQKRHGGSVIYSRPHGQPSVNRTLATWETISASVVASNAEDKWIARGMDSIVPSSPPAQLAALHSSCLSALGTLRMPTSRNEEYRFTDLTAILKRTLCVPGHVSDEAISTAVAQHQLKRAVAATLVVVDGVVQEAHSKINGLPADAFVGPVKNAPAHVVASALGAQSRGRGGPFAILNGAAATDVAIVYVPAHAVVEAPIHVLYFSSGVSTSSGETNLSASAPRTLIVLEEGAVAEIIEEFAPTAAEGDSSYLCTAVAEIELDDRASLKHSYVEIESSDAFHLKSTLVNQGTESNYSLVEARVGGQLTRHDVGIDQLGGNTETGMRSFLLAGQNQLHDLHSKLKLDHPDGHAEQLHKCIAAHPSSRAVFDGNVRVNRLAQKTDAQQLSRNLLLTPRATVNVKPNLQIIADDVKCTHGCTVSDLEDEELFYLRARGIDPGTARQLLVYSFGREIVQGLAGGDGTLLGRVESAVKELLDITAAEWVAAE